MSREAKLWRKLRPHGKHSQGAHVYLDAYKLQEALLQCNIKDPSDLSKMRYRVSSTQTNRRSAKLVIEVKHLDDIDPNDLD